jgi:error-prone DNA polymerase
MPLFPEPKFTEAKPLLQPPAELTSIIADYASTGLSLRQHPLALLRAQLGPLCRTAAELWSLPDKSRVYAAGLVITRQRPGSAANVTFVTLEDETGFINLVIWEQVAEQQRSVLLNATVLGVNGEIQKQDGVLHVIARQLDDRSMLLSSLNSKSRNFR